MRVHHKNYAFTQGESFVFLKHLKRFVLMDTISRQTKQSGFCYGFLSRQRHFYKEFNGHLHFTGISTEITYQMLK